MLSKELSVMAILCFLGKSYVIRVEQICFAERGKAAFVLV